MPSGTLEFLTPQRGKKGFNLLVVLTENGGQRVLEQWAKISMLVLGDELSKSWLSIFIKANTQRLPIIQYKRGT